MAARKARPKQRLAVSLDPDLYDWLEQRVGPGKPFGSMTHAVESALVLLKGQHR